MSDSELRDAYIAVELELPNGALLRGKPIRWRAGMAIKALLLEFMVEPTDANRAAAFEAFSQASGVTEAQIEALDPDVTVGEMVDLINRFTNLLRPGRTAAGNGATPAPIAAPVASPVQSPSA